MSLMNKDEALIYIWDILEEYYQKSHDDEAQILLGDLDPNPIRLNTGAKTADPAAWGDWLEAISKITLNDYLSENEAKKAIVALMKEYDDHHGYELKKAIKYFQSLI